MPLPLQNLDNRTFQDLMEEAISLIPRHSKEWTNFNPSGPGITLLELFAWLTETVTYRLNQVGEKNYLTFLDLLGISLQDGESVEEGIERAVKYMADRYRMITEGDYELLALRAMKDALEAEGELAKDAAFAGRVVRLDNRNLDPDVPEINRDGHISVILIPDNEENYPSDGVLKRVREQLDVARILTHRLHVVGPDFKRIAVSAWLVLEEGADFNVVGEKAGEKLKAYYDPVRGGADGTGWPLGRYLYRSEVYEVLEGVSGVDHIKKVCIEEDEELAFVALDENQLIELVPSPFFYEVKE